MNTLLSFRAECMADVKLFRREAMAAGVSTKSIVYLDKQGLPDVEVEMLCSESDIVRLCYIARDVEDGHVMVQTMRICPLSENSLIRDLNINPFVKET